MENAGKLAKKNLSISLQKLQEMKKNAESWSDMCPPALLEMSPGAACMGWDDSDSPDEVQLHQCKQCGQQIGGAGSRHAAGNCDLVTISETRCFAGGL